MRAGGGCTVPQALTAEAESVVKQAVILARRRGHAQVTPLHVANTMLSTSSGLLRTACLQSHSHPLQCKALELCFNVALNRLPASSPASSPMLGPHSSQYPSISNALVAAFKRAQAHQRRGSIENQQQPLLAVKIELVQLIISVLDDPSVSRVMREAGFSSTQVKSNVEQAVSLEISSQTPSKSKESDHLSLSQSNPSKVAGKPIRVSDQVTKDEIAMVIDNLMSQRRRNIVIVGECVATLEGIVRGAMDRVEKGEVPHEALRDVEFISLPLSSIGHLCKEEVEQKFMKLKSLLRSCIERGVVLLLGDLKWTTENRASFGNQQIGRNNSSHYCPVEHVIMELGKLVCGFGETNGRFWLLGIATFQTYMRCKTGHPSIETVWDLHPFTIPAHTLSLSLNTDSDLHSEFKGKKAGNGCSNWLVLEGGEGETETAKHLTCCTDCSANFEMEARSLQSNSTSNSDSATATTSSLPSWLQQYKDENKRSLARNDQDCVSVRQLCKKWNSICSSVHKQQPHSISEKTLTFSSIVSPSSSTSGFSYDPHQHYSNTHNTQHGWPWRDQHFWISEADHKTIEPNLRLYIPENTDQIHPFSSNPNSTPNSASSSDVMQMEYVQRFKELNAENLKNLCTALEKKVPWQKTIIPEIASTILQCRSGMVRRKEKKWKNNNIDANNKEETWFFFQGVDVEGKEKMARELARLVFGSQKTNFISIALSSFSSTRADSTEDNNNLRNKRSREEQSCTYLERFSQAVSTNPHGVFLLEDIEQADYCSQIGIKQATEKGKIVSSNGDEVSLSDAIIILSCESFCSRSRACSPPVKQKSSDDGADEEIKGGGVMKETTSPCVSLDLNISVEDDNSIDDDQSIDDIGLLESVDRRIIFKIQEL